MNALQRDLKKLVPLVESLGAERVESDPHRQRFHVQPTVGWLNDPNGLCRIGDTYHVYIMICASEDVGNADPQALVMAVNASLAVERVGMPEAQIILAQAVTYIATAPKSNRSCEAVFQAMQEVQATGDLPIPAHLQDAHYKGAAKLGHGTGYKYAHDYPNDYVEQQYLPYELSGREFYQPSGNGYEVKIREHMARIKKEAAEASSENKES